MEEGLRDRLLKDLEDASWDMLAPHHEREALFVIGEDVELVDAGIALANDDVELVKEWQQTGRIKRPTEDDVDEYSQDKDKHVWQFLIIQPYVIVKKIPKLH